ncbi:MAG: 1,6-anhydro-N-acetylmuramyl-L-alanine amidase AmpD, partial [Arenicellales bacterium]|nr:1,6-anhydro-N-acetylmuramyl-L-alanine amidase AmpD [Arenicellales bacterium]
HPDYVGLQDLQVAAHFFIRRDGSVLQFVPVHRRAWHAGISEYRGRSRVNDFSIGVELEGCDDQIFEDYQYQALVWLTELLSTAYPVIGAEQIVGHSDIAAGRKTDPGAHFDWARYRQSLLS